MKEKNYQLTLTACYLGFVTQAISANFAPLLFTTFQSEYGISIGQTSLLPMVFYFSQLFVDFICAKFVDRIGYRFCVVLSEIISALGLIGLAFFPDRMMDPFTGLLLCVIVYAIGSGLIEVLVSPIVEACPFDHKESVMSLLHSFYCWGSVAVIAGSSLFFHFFGIKNWRILTCLWAVIPVINTVNFSRCPIEKLVDDGQGMTISQLFRNNLFWILCVLMICAGASELAMAQWASAFAESALHVSKTIGDLAGPCGFAFLMGLSRHIFGKHENLDLRKYMVLSGLLCVICYLLAGLSSAAVMGLIGCAMCGFAVGIMWPGSISIASQALPTGGTAMFALLALAGDLGGSLGPRLVGLMAQNSGDNLQAGMLYGVFFPVILVICMFLLRQNRKSVEKWK